MPERINKPEIMSVKNPAFFLCTGVSGAGCTTAVNQSYIEGLANLSPTQFVTRLLRPTERRGDQYYPVTDIILERIPNQIAIEDKIYGNRYGFFKPAIERIRKTLDNGQNVISNAENTGKEWCQLLGSDYRVISLFFAPSDPEEAVRRIVARAKQGNQTMRSEELELRKQTNKQRVKGVFAFDYWIDTTVFEEIMPAVRTVIESESDGVIKTHGRLISVKTGPKKIYELINGYNDAEFAEIETEF